MLFGILFSTGQHRDIPGSRGSGGDISRIWARTEPEITVVEVTFLGLGQGWARNPEISQWKSREFLHICQKFHYFCQEHAEIQKSHLGLDPRPPCQRRQPLWDFCRHTLVPRPDSETHEISESVFSKSMISAWRRGRISERAFRQSALHGQSLGVGNLEIREISKNREVKFLKSMFQK